MVGFAVRRPASMLALVLLAHGCAEEIDFLDRSDELRREIGMHAEVCPSVDEDLACGPDGPMGYRCIANALRACNPAEVYTYDADSEAYWFVVPSGDTCELVVLSLNPAVLSDHRWRFNEQTCEAIVATPSWGCTSFVPRDCN